MLRMYREVDPGYADAIMEMAIADSRSIVRVRDRVSRAEMFAVLAGAFVSVVLPLTGLVLGFVGLVMGHHAAALLAFIAPALAAVAKIIAATRGNGAD